MQTYFIVSYLEILLPDDGIKRDPERENCAVLTIAALTANAIHIQVAYNSVTRYNFGDWSIANWQYK